MQGVRPAGRGISPPWRRVTFSAMRKSPKNRQGAAQMGTPCPYSRPPGPPFTGAANEAGWFVIAKARVAQLTGFPSSFAAAHWAIIEPQALPFWIAPLCGWGSIPAQWDGGRVLDPPLWSGKGVYLCIGTGHFRAQAPGGPVCRPYKIRGTLRSFRRGRSQTGPRAHTVRPYGGKRPGSVGSANPGAEAEPHQSQFSSRSGPQWGRTKPHPSTPDFARRKCSAHFKG